MSIKSSSFFSSDLSRRNNLSSASFFSSDFKNKQETRIQSKNKYETNKMINGKELQRKTSRSFARYKSKDKSTKNTKEKTKNF